MPYSERYVAYIDILGFSDYKKLENNPRLYEALVKQLSEIQAREPKSKAQRRLISSFANVF